MENKSNSSGFILLGFPGIDETFSLPISLALFFVFLTSLFANGTVIVLIGCNRRLYQPMYILILNLAVSDLLFDIITLPKIISKYWFDDGWISFAGCTFQLFSAHFLGCVDAYILLLMSIDRYVAICKPLRHSSLMTSQRIVVLCGIFWVFAALIGLTIAVLDFNVKFCKHYVRSCFCQTMWVLSLACPDVNIRRKIILGMGIVVIALPLFFIILSYGFIIRVIVTQAHSESRRRAFYTCSTQLSMICLYFIPRLLIIVADQVSIIRNEDLNVLLLCLYSFIPHIANPVIYCLRTKEIRRTFKNHIKRRILKTERVPASDVN